MLHSLFAKKNAFAVTPIVFLVQLESSVTFCTRGCGRNALMVLRLVGRLSQGGIRLQRCLVVGRVEFCSVPVILQVRTNGGSI